MVCGEEGGEGSLEVKIKEDFADVVEDVHGRG